MQMIKRARRILFVAMLSVLVTGPLHAQNWPTKPIRIVVGFPPGVPPELAARALAENMTGTLGQPIVVETRPGAAATIAASSVAQAAPDGYTLLMALAANMSSGPHLMPSAKYDPVKSFSHIGFIQRGAYFLGVRSDLAVSNFRDLLAYSNANPGKLNAAIPGFGSMHHLTWELLMEQTGMKVTLIPVAGTAQAITEVLGGRMDLYMDGPGANYTSQVKSGKMRWLGHTGERRLSLNPDVPTLSESGAAGFASASWWGVSAPAETPATIVSRINAALGVALASTAVRDRLKLEGVSEENMRPGTPEEMVRWVEAEYVRWGKLIKARNISVK
jgi:tripartite-type tricarboxylate transporter receptor subunit TctC